MCGLVTAGRWFGWSDIRLSKDERRPGVGVAHSALAGHSTRCHQPLFVVKQSMVLFVQNGQGPAPAGQLTGDRCVRNGGAFPAFDEPEPAVM